MKKMRFLSLVLTIASLTVHAMQQTNAQPAPQTAGGENRVEGSLTYNGETVGLKYAYANMDYYDGPPDRRKSFILLLFTDKPITSAIERDGLISRVKSGQLKALSIEIDKITHRVSSYSIYADKKYGVITSSSDASRDEVFNITMTSPTSVQGTASTREAQRSSEHELAFGHRHPDPNTSTKQPLRNGESEYLFDLNFKAATRTNESTGNLLVYPPVNVEIARAEGGMTYEGKTRKLNYVYAHETSDMFGDDVPLIEFVITELPNSQESPRKENVPYLEFKTERPESHGSPQKENVPYGVSVALESGNAAFSGGNGASSLGFVFLPGNVVEGRASYDHKGFNCDVAFKASFEPDVDAPVSSRAGKAIPGGGGAPGKAFLEFIRVAASALQQAESQKEDARLDYIGKKVEELRKYRFEGRKSLAFIFLDGGLKSARVLRGFTDGSKATLHFEILLPGERTEGRVNMHLEDNQWKIGKIALKGKGGTESYN
jgi:hypothetical protein